MNNRNYSNFGMRAAALGQERSAPAPGLIGGGGFVLNCTLSDSYSAFDSTFQSLQGERCGSALRAGREQRHLSRPAPRPVPSVSAAGDAAAGEHGRCPALGTESWGFTDRRTSFSPWTLPLTHSSSSAQVKTWPGAAHVPSSSVFLSAASTGNADTLKNKRRKKSSTPPMHHHTQKLFSTKKRISSHLHLLLDINANYVRLKITSQ